MPVFERVCRVISTPRGDFAVFRVGDDWSIMRLSLPLVEEEALVRTILARSEGNLADDATAD